MLTCFNDFWHTASWRNLTLVDCKFTHITCENIRNTLRKIKYFISSKVHCFLRRKWVALKNTGCVVWQHEWKQCYRECSKWPPCAFAIGLIHDALLQSSPRLNKPLLKMISLTFPRYSSYSMWVRWANLQPSNVKSFRIWCAKND